MTYKRKWILPCLLLFVCILNISPVRAAITAIDQPDPAAFLDNPDLSTVPAPTETGDISYRAKVIKILESGTIVLDGQPQEYQRLELEILNGNEKNKHVIIDHGKDFVIGVFQKVLLGVFIQKLKVLSNSLYVKYNFSHFYLYLKRVSPKSQ